MATDSKELFAKRLEGKVALITGGANGIGAATARLFSLHGARLVLADIDDDEGHSLASTLGGSAYATYVHCDVTDEAQVAAAVDAAVATYGTIDIVYANAGIMDTPYRTLDCLDLASFERTMAVNVTGVFLTLKHAARVMKAAGRRGGIVVTASIAAVMAGITPHAYTCSKHALLGLVRNAAAELGMYGIRVNAVSPSALASKQSCSALGLAPQEVEQIVRDKAPLRGEVVEPLRADDIAEAVLFLSKKQRALAELSRYLIGMRAYHPYGSSGARDWRKTCRLSVCSILRIFLVLLMSPRTASKISQMLQANLFLGLSWMAFSSSVASMQGMIAMKQEYFHHQARCKFVFVFL